MVRLWWLWWPQLARPPPHGGVKRLSTARHPRGVAPPQPDTTWCGCSGCTNVRPPPRWWFSGGQPLFDINHDQEVHRGCDDVDVGDKVDLWWLLVTGWWHEEGVDGCAVEEVVVHEEAGERSETAGASRGACAAAVNEVGKMKIAAVGCGEAEIEVVFGVGCDGLIDR
ncbi:hypothetical protein Tco_0259927 [Tanacetum coccineum]